MMLATWMGWTAENPTTAIISLGLVVIYVLAGAIAGGLKGAGLRAPAALTFIDSFVQGLFAQISSVPRKLFGKKSG